jgi:hypothetical protein
MVGFAHSAQGAAEGQLALGLAVYERLIAQAHAPVHALLAFKLPDASGLFYYLMIRDGFILADGDRFGQEDAIRSAFAQDAQAGGWDLLVCPEHWNVPDSQVRGIDEFLAPPKRKGRWPETWRLKLVHKPMLTTYLKVLFLFGAIMGSAYGYMAWKNARIAEEAALVQAQLQAEAEAERLRQLQKEPWPTMPRAAEFSDACEQALRKAGITAGNWTMREFVCKDGVITLKWEATGTYPLVDQILQFHPQAKIAAEGTAATVVYPLAIETITGAPEKLQTMEANIQRLNDAKFVYGMQVNTTLSKPGAAAPGTPGAMQMPPSMALPWSQFGVEVQGDLELSVLVAALDAPGLRLNSVQGTYRDGSFKYQVSGIQYVKN